MKGTGQAMTKNIVMPKMGYDMTEGKLLHWIKREGDWVESGEIIAEIETDKVSIEMEAFDSGVLQRILVQEEEIAAVGEPIAILVERGELSAASPSPSLSSIQPPQALPTPATLAAHDAVGPETALFREQPLTRLQQTTGRRMAESKAAIPHFYVMTHVDMSEALALRRNLNAQAARKTNISVNDLVIKATSSALINFPELNASFAGDRLILHHTISMSVAVAVHDGLVTPVVHNSNQKTLEQIAQATKRLIEQAHAGKGRAEDYDGGTFTVSNLGMFDIATFVAIINPPQVAILAVGSVQRVPVYRGEDLVPCERMTITLSADHRATDGATGARFLQEIRKNLEHPELLLDERKRGEERV